MPLKKKLKENEFYCVGVRKKCALKPDDICLTTWKNGANALVGNCEKFNCTANKIVKKSNVDRLEKKYGRCRKSRKASKSRRKSRRKSRKASKSRRKSRKASKSRRKSSKRNCKYGVKKSGGCKKKPGRKKN